MDRPQVPAEVLDFTETALQAAQELALTKLELERLLRLLSEAREFLEHGTPIHPGSELANAICKAVGHG